MQSDNEKQRKKFRRKLKKELKLRGLSGKRNLDIILICSKCKAECPITTNHKELYTEEVRKNWICPVCK